MTFRKILAGVLVSALVHTAAFAQAVTPTPASSYPTMSALSGSEKFLGNQGGLTANGTASILGDYFLARADLTAKINTQIAASACNFVLAGTNVTKTPSGNNCIFSAAGGGGGGGTPIDVQVFTSSGTWTKPAGSPVTTRPACIGGGAGGASGRRGAAGTARSGGGGGQGGGWSDRVIFSSLLGATETVTIGAGGAGGAAVASNDTNGLPGTIGGNSTFGSWVSARGGGPALAVGAVNAAAQQASNGGTFGGQGAGTNVTGAGIVPTRALGVAPGGGGAGGSISTADVVLAAGDGAAPGFGGPSTGGGVSGGTTAAGGAGASSSTGDTLGGGGGGGGAASITQVGFAGGVGGFPGGGGGGGGASLNGFASGAGGAGWSGVCIVYTTF